MIAFATLATFSLSLISCGGDDEDDNGIINPDGKGLCGKIVANVPYYASSPETTYYASNAEWSAGHTEVIGTGIYSFSNGAEFTVDLFTSTDTDDWNGSIDWIIKLTGELAVGSEATVYNTSWSPIFGTSSWYFCKDKDLTGKVIVKSIDGSNITLQFKDFQFDYYVDFSKKVDIIVNGDITFSQKE